ncbi:hypothetical protein MMC28_009610 [Mycoblastus sanguinarius]|nr:hypothetical protein [Mycoblastus sanguinarius]
MQLTIIALAFALLSYGTYAAPLTNVNDRPRNADTSADHAYAIEVEGMLAKLD